jgi:aspartyl-tRNA(Asn)/glutamyl-tRNA(Gln) amidotransferase subunit A
MTIQDIKREIAATSVSAVIRQAIERAKQDEHHALLEIIEERALAQAAELDARAAEGAELGPLGGVPFIAKDNMLTFGSKTTAASHLLETFDAPFQAEAIERLEAAGAICIAKANLDAFAHGGSTENSAFGPTTNPKDAHRVAGGSSGGSAAAVALDIVPFSLGTDTGGSIRQPAAFCGVVGLKPTYGSVSRYGVVAMASSTDVIGPMTTTVEDARAVMQIIAGRDDKDMTTITSPYAAVVKPGGKKIGVIKEWLGDGVEPEVRQAVQATIERLVGLGYTVEEVSMPTLQSALAVYYIIVPAEVASNLARYDGIRYGVRPDTAQTLDDVYGSTRSQGFMPENKRRILIGNYVLSSGYYDAYFQKAAKVRTLIVDEFERAFTTYDFLVGPTTPTVAFKLGQNTHDPLSMYVADQMTVSASLAGLPAISIPARTDGLPVGFQILGNRSQDLAVLSLAEELEKGGSDE